MLHADAVGERNPSFARHGVAKDASYYASLALGLKEDWLNRAVDAFTARDEEVERFVPFGSYPSDGPTGLRVFLVRLEYLCAMKLAALKRTDVGDKDYDDALKLAMLTGVRDEEGLRTLYGGFFPEDALAPNAEERLRELVADLAGYTP
ncbi:hypothetical protein ACFZ8E_03985 [Methylobacterium sp. HMF5984]|uniref:hypothetical protein n=1 Tax=Methylobacterium sp. HMF5984 TaxID=3367370 RepID=UPI00385237A4